VVVADEDLGLLWVWYGDAGIQILDEHGNVVDRFSIDAALSRKLKAHEVKKIILAYRDEMLRDRDE
jgi:hypothetical protein